MEHRWGKRITVDVAVTLRLRSGALESGRIVNVSLSGALVRTEAPLPLFSWVAVQFEAGDCVEGPPRTVSAHVVRETPGGMGLEWSVFATPAICALVLGAPAVVSTSPGFEPAQVCDVDSPFFSRDRSPASVSAYNRPRPSRQ